MDKDYFKTHTWKEILAYGAAIGIPIVTIAALYKQNTGKEPPPIPPDPNPKPKPKFRPCYGPTYTIGCMSEVITKAQGCVGSTQDGKFGKNTSAALVRAGFPQYASRFTKEDVDNVICKSNPNPEDKDRRDNPNPYDPKNLKTPDFDQARRNIDDNNYKKYGFRTGGYDTNTGKYDLYNKPDGESIY
jgi:hypothetical protein